MDCFQIGLLSDLNLSVIVNFLIYVVLSCLTEEMKYNLLCC